MLRTSKKQPQTVSEKISKLLGPPSDSDSDELSDVPRVVDFEDEYDLGDARSTEFRKHNVKLLSEQSARYKGKITTRKELEADQHGSEAESEDDEDLPYEESDSEVEQTAALQAYNKKLVSKQAELIDEDSDSDDGSKAELSNDEDSDAEQQIEDDSDDDDGEDEDDDDGEEEDDDADTDANERADLLSKTNKNAEIQKGVCVQNQLRIWERLLELRINTQKLTTKANKLPEPTALQALSAENENLQSALSEVQNSTANLLQRMLLLQSALSDGNSELRRQVKRKQPTESSSEPPTKRFAAVLQYNFQNMCPYRNEVLLKWDDRTKLLTPGAGAKRKTLQEDYDIIKKINSALANRETLLEKSQILKNNQQPQVDAEQAAPGERQPHIYDDSDFYHQQLRELIEYKASTTSNMSEITKQLIELQKLRQKMKKKVDTRASKGRKLRYVVHNKLINFMAPNEHSDWTDGSKSELYKSLFV